MNLEKIEAIFFNVLEDISDYLPDLTLVGGWVPYIYPVRERSSLTGFTQITFGKQRSEIR